MSAVELKEIGMRICERRRQLNITQEQLAEKMEVSVQMISNLERGNKAIRIDNLIKIGKILNLSTDYILTGDVAANATDLSDKISKLSPEDFAYIEETVDFLISKMY